MASRNDRETGVKKADVIERMRQSLQSRGVEVELSPIFRGASGAKHTFDLAIAKDGVLIPIDIKIAESGAVELGEILETYAKSLNAKTRPAILVAIPEASRDARKSTMAFGMILVEGAGAEEALQAFDLALNKLWIKDESNR